MPDLVIRGAEDVAKLSRDLRAIDGPELRREFYRGINRATKPLKDDAKTNAVRVLPRRGGLGAFVAKTSLSTRTRGGQNPGVRIVAKKTKRGGRASDVAAIDRGRVRHPVFGNRTVWVMQSVTSGWFTKPMEAGAQPVRRELLSVLDGVKRRIAKAR